MPGSRRSLARKRRPVVKQRQKQLHKIARRRRQAARSEFDFRHRQHGYHHRIVWEWQRRGQQHRRYATQKGTRRLY